MVRQWRNDPVVANNYEYREFITPEMQQEWFRRVNNTGNLYTVIEYNGEKIGVINIKNIDWATKECEGGIFIPYTKYHQTFIPALISYVTTEIIFILFDWNMAYAHVLRDRKNNQEFVRLLGYELEPGQEEKANQRWIITRETFEKKAKRLLKAISALVNVAEPGTLLIEKHEYEDSLVLEWEQIAGKSSRIFRKGENEQGRFYCYA